jgi:hypothetical protein
LTATASRIQDATTKPRKSQLNKTEKSQLKKSEKTKPEKRKKRKKKKRFFYLYSLMAVAGIVRVSVTPSIERIFSPTK